MKKTSGLIKSRASKPKNHKWANVDRFSLGHDQSAMMLMPEEDRLKILARRESREPRRTEIGVWRSESFGKSKEDLVYESAQRLIRAGRVNSVDEAVEKATAAVQASWHHQLGSEMVVEAHEWRSKN